MPQDDTNSSAKTPKRSASKVLPDHGQWQRFRTPQSVKRLFDRFPLRTYPPNELPQRTATSRAQHTLYIFTTAEGAKVGAPSFNPGCLKWQVRTRIGLQLDRKDQRADNSARQAYLTFTGLGFTTVASNNHASPTGALPFLIPPTSSSIFTTEPVLPVPSTKLQRWARERLNKPNGFEAHDEESSSRLSLKETGSINRVGSNLGEEPSDMRYDAYMSLLDHRIRDAWVHSSSRLHYLPNITNPKRPALHTLPHPVQLRCRRQTPLHPPHLFQPSRPPIHILQPTRRS